MHDLVCMGLEGTSPLGMLASLGLFRLLAIRDSDVQMGWTKDQGWHPRFRSDLRWESGTLAEWLAAKVHDLGAVKAEDIASKQRKAREAKAQIKPLAEALKKAVIQAKADAKAKGLKGAEATTYVREATSAAGGKLQAAEAEYRSSLAQLGDALGQGIAHLGDVIGVQPETFRSKAQEALVAPAPDKALLLDCLASQASDARIEGGRLVPTLFSFGNGAGGQCLLKDFRDLATSVTSEEMSALFSSRTPLRRETSSLNWNPLDQRSYAHQWKNPEGEAKQVEVAANVLAFIGLACLPAMPGPWRLMAVGFGDGISAWTWPLWESPLRLDVVKSLLSDPELQAEEPNRTALAVRGVTAHCRARRYSTNKRYFFSPAEIR